MGGAECPNRCQTLVWLELCHECMFGVLSFWGYRKISYTTWSWCGEKDHACVVISGPVPRTFIPAHQTPQPDMNKDVALCENGIEV